MPGDLVLQDVRVAGGPARSVTVAQGRVVDGPAPPGAVVVSGGGGLLLPGLVDAHAHLDKTLWGMGWRPHAAGPRLIDKIETERRLKGEWGIDPARQSARMVVQALRMGTTAIRTHVDVDDVVGLSGIEALMRTRAEYADAMDIQLVAFPQSGLMCRPGVAGLMEQAMRLGADVVGGLDPCAIDRDPKGQLDLVFGLAERFGKPVDIHLHEPGQLGAFSLELILERTRALGMAGQVTVSHAFCLGDPDPALVHPLLDALAELDVAIATTAPASRPVPAAAALRQRGIRLCAGSDGVRDTWGPYGTADMLERAMLLGLRNNFRLEDELEYALAVCSCGGAAVMGLPAHGVAPGCRADFVVVAAETPGEAVAARPPRRLVIKGGRLVARDGEPLVSAP